MTQEYDYLGEYTLHYEFLIANCADKQNYTLAYFWLNTYENDLIASISLMSPEMRRECINHFNYCRDELERLCTTNLVEQHFGDDEEGMEKYLKRLEQE